MKRRCINDAINQSIIKAYNHNVKELSDWNSGHNLDLFTKLALTSDVTDSSHWIGGGLKFVTVR
jgi:hypothetical protein